MKRIISILSLMCAAFCGCIDTVPDPDKVAITANAVGKAAAYAADFIADKDAMSTIITVVDVVQDVVPDTDQTFVTAWTPLIDAEFAKLVDAGKIKPDQAILAKSATILAAEGLDYLFKTHPKWKTYTGTPQIAVKSFIKGFKTVVENRSAIAAPNKVDESDNYDKEAYKYLLKKAKK